MNNSTEVRFQVSPSSGVAIYRQVMDQVRRMVVAGRLVPGDELPSVRTVAKQLEVNPMTLSKAYSMLEAEGILQRRRGKGMIVAELQGGPQTKAERLATLKPALKAVAAHADQLGLPADDVMGMFKDIVEGKA